MKYGIFGAGIVGSCIGARLTRVGHDVVMVGRPDFVAGVRAQGGLWAADAQDPDPSSVIIEATTDPSRLRDCHRILVTVKATQTAQAADTLAQVIPPGTTVTSLQNGVQNRALLAKSLGEDRVFSGIVAWNAIREGEARFRRTTSGPIVLGGPSGLVQHLQETGYDAWLHPRMDAVLWGKLLFNLGNAIIALTSISLPDAILDRDARAVSQAALREGLLCCQKAGIDVEGFGRLRPKAMMHLMSLPGWAIRTLLPSVIRTDPRARSSMWEDLNRRRPTEIHLLNGEVVALGRATGTPTPVNSALVRLVMEAEERKEGSPQMQARELRRTVESPA